MRSKLAFLMACIAPLCAHGLPPGKTYVNSIGMRLVHIAPGRFRMGSEELLPQSLAPKPHMRKGDPDEKPVHTVRITKSFYMGAFEVTNAQYEQFDPAHRKLRGKLGFSKADDEAVVFVSWYDAVRFTKWLSKREHLPYRLPTEAEWEYAARAGTTTAFYSGDSLPRESLRNARESWFPDADHDDLSRDVVDLTVGKNSPNAWGLCDVHGNVEEWCLDWYGPYQGAEQVDPVGAASGHFRVTRGGSHSTEEYYLRSANRMATLPDDRSWLIGFRVVLGYMPKTKPQPRLVANSRRQKSSVLSAPRKPIMSSAPYFRGPRVFVNIPQGEEGPLFSHHNHFPSVAALPNGDLLAVWYTCVDESGRELAVAQSRLRYGADEWEPATLFWDAPDRNDHAPVLWFDGKKTLFHFNGLSAAATWGNLAVIMRKSNDNGRSWSNARLIIPEHGVHAPIDSVFRAQDGSIVLPVDASTLGNGGTRLWMSRDNGKSWFDSGGTIAGIHAAAVQLKDGSLLAFGRGDNIDSHMPKSISFDMGRTWQRSASEFDPIDSGQRAVMLRLKEGPIFFASFAKEMTITDASGKQQTVHGLFGAVSFDEGKTWPVRRLISDDGPERVVDGGAWTGRFVLGPSSAEPKGYLAVTQSIDGVIHLLSSRLHYAFNFAWLMARAAPPSADPDKLSLK